MPCVRPCKPLCGLAGMKEGNHSGPGGGGSFGRFLAGICLGRRKGWGRECPTPPTSSRSADSFEESAQGSFGQKIGTQGVGSQENCVITG